MRSSTSSRHIAGLVDVYETLDRPALVVELAKRAPGAHVLVQVNTTGEISKGGCVRDELLGHFRARALQVLGLNALAWRERSALQAQQASLHTILTTTFPSVTVVVDAPLQMQREIDLLQQKSGAVSRTDFEPLLAALASVLPAGQTPQQIHFANQSLRVQGVAFDSNAAGVARLQAQGLRLRQDGHDTWVLQAEGTP